MRIRLYINFEAHTRTSVHLLDDGKAYRVLHQNDETDEIITSYNVYNKILAILDAENLNNQLS